MSSSNGEEAVQPKSFSFGFSKTISSKPKFVPKELTEKEEKDFIKDVKNGKIEGSKPKEVKVDLVIPCTGNKIKFPRTKQNIDVKTEPTDAESSLAARELLAEAQQWQENQDRVADGKLDPNFVVPLNPDDKEFLDADVSSRAEVPSVDDYEKIPIQGFGLGKKFASMNMFYAAVLTYHK